MHGSIFSQFVGSIVRNNLISSGRSSYGQRLLPGSWNGCWRSSMPYSSLLADNNKFISNKYGPGHATMNFGSPSSLSTRFISTSCALFAEPLKKKKKMDPAVVRAREERRKKKIEKAIRKLEKVSRQLKPLDENEIPIQLINEPGQRDRRLPTISTEDANERWRLQKEWSKYKCDQNSQNMKLFTRIIQSQEEAMAQLRYESEELYMAACEPDESLLPFKFQGPVETPAIENYQTPQGDYLDVSKKWDEKSDTSALD